MGKIKGWKKILDKKNNMEWEQEKGFYPKEGRPQHVEIRQDSKGGWMVWYGPRDTYFHSKERAYKFATSWMRRHTYG